MLIPGKLYKIIKSGQKYYKNSFQSSDDIISGLFQIDDVIMVLDVKIIKIRPEFRNKDSSKMFDFKILFKNQIVWTSYRPKTDQDFSGIQNIVKLCY